MGTYDEQFKKVIARTLKWEGGFSDDPDDPGGRTMYGILQREYNVYRQEKGLPSADVKNISMDEVMDIYYNKYYKKVHAELFHDSIKVQWKVFDIGVNQGTTRAVMYVQMCIGTKVDGDFGLNSQTALLKYQLANPDWTIPMMQFLKDQQTKRYQHLVEVNPKLKKFLKGWLRRANDIGKGIEW